MLSLLAVALLAASSDGYVRLEAYTLAGSPGLPGSSDGVGANASFAAPRQLFTTPAFNGSMYVADVSQLRLVSPGGKVTTVPSKPFLGLSGITGNAAGNLLLVSDLNAIFSVTLAGTVRLLAGAVTERGDVDGVGSAARFNNPFAITLSANDSTLYVADRWNMLIRAVDMATAETTTVAGDGYGKGVVGGGRWVDGVGTLASFNTPQGIALSQSGILYVADVYNRRIRMISPSRQVSTLAGSSAALIADGIGSLARFSNALNLALEPQSGNLYVADACAVRLVSPFGAVRTLTDTLCGYADGFFSLHTQVISNTTLLGSIGGIILLPSPAPDLPPSVLVTDTTSRTLRVLARPPAGAADVCTLSTLTGENPTRGYTDGSASDSRFSGSCFGLCVSFTGKVYVADGQNYRLRAVAPDGTTTTVAGSGIAESLDGVGTSAGLNNLRGCLEGSDGRLYLAEYSGNRVRILWPNLTLTTFAGSGSPIFLDGISTSAGIPAPVHFARNPFSGFLYVTNPTRLRSISPSGTVGTVVGNAVNADIDGAGTNASFCGLAGLIWLSPDLLMTATWCGKGGNVRLINLTTTPATVTTMAPNVSAATAGTPASKITSLANLRSVVFTGAAFYFADYNNGILFMASLDFSVLSIAAGSGKPGRVDGVGTSAGLFQPADLALDSDGDLYVQETTGAVRIFACRDCPLGSYCPTNTSLFPCPAGTYGTASARSLAAACTGACPPGSFCPPGSTLDTIQTCPVGSSCAAGSGAPTPCAPGTFSPTPASVSCVSCPPGSLAPQPGSGICASYCPPGTYRSNPGGVDALTSCALCPPGTYGAYDGAIACMPCPPSTFSPSTGAINASVCQPCPAQTTSPASSVSPADCFPVDFACPPLQQPSLGVASFSASISSPTARSAGPTSAAQCSPLACPPPLALAPAATACRGCPAGSFGSFPACTPCTEAGSVCVGGQGAPLRALEESLDAGRAAVDAAGGSGSGTGVSPVLWGIGAAACSVGMLLLALTFACPRLGLKDALDRFSLRGPERAGGHPTMLPTNAGALCTIAGYSCILGLALLQVTNFFSPQNTQRGDASGVLTRDALMAAQGFPWKGVGGVTLSLAVSALSSEGSAGNASACRSALGWSASSLVAGTWVALPGGSGAVPPSVAAAQLASRAPVSLQFDCLGCVFSPASSLQFSLHHSCQALHIFATATTADGLTSYQSLAPSDTCGSTLGGALVAVFWQLSPMLHLLNDTLPFTRSTSAKGYQLLSQQTSAARAPRQSSAGSSSGSGGVGVDFSPLSSAVSVTVQLPVNAMLQTSTLTQALTWVQLLTGLSGLMGLLGAFGVLAAVLRKLAPQGEGGGEGAVTQWQWWPIRFRRLWLQERMSGRGRSSSSSWSCPLDWQRGHLTWIFCPLAGPGGLQRGAQNIRRWSTFPPKATAPLTLEKTLQCMSGRCARPL
jgi:hypothetical protein